MKQSIDDFLWPSSNQVVQEEVTWNGSNLNDEIMELIQKNGGIAMAWCCTVACMEVSKARVHECSGMWHTHISLHA